MLIYQLDVSYVFILYCLTKSYGKVMKYWDKKMPCWGNGAKINTTPGKNIV